MTKAEERWQFIFELVYRLVVFGATPVWFILSLLKNGVHGGLWYGPPEWPSWWPLLIPGFFALPGVLLENRWRFK